MKYILIISIILLLRNEAYSQKKVDSLTHYPIGWVKLHPTFFLKANDSTVVSLVRNVYVLRGKRYYFTGKLDCK